MELTKCTHLLELVSPAVLWKSSSVTRSSNCQEPFSGLTLVMNIITVNMEHDSTCIACTAIGVHNHPIRHLHRMHCDRCAQPSHPLKMTREIQNSSYFHDHKLSQLLAWSSKLTDLIGRVQPQLPGFISYLFQFNIWWTLLVSQSNSHFDVMVLKTV
jgi:hypothetical protein